MATEVWRHANTAETNVNSFRNYVNRKYSLNIRTFKELHTWSVSDTEAFASAIWVFCGINCSVPPTKVASGLDLMFPPPRWFPGAKLNFSQNILCTGLAVRPFGVAVSACREDGVVTELTFLELEARVAIWANALRKFNVGVGDRIATVLTNSIDCMVILLAAGAVGAIFSSTSPDMGSTGIIQRYSQLRPKVFICETAVSYNGRLVDLRQKLAKANQELEEFVPEMQLTIIVNGPSFSGRNVKRAKDILSPSATEVIYEQLPFDHPIYILYSSGTTGPPKCICHAAGGALLQQKKELILQNNMGPNSTYYQYTTTGWMMWNYMVASLSCGSRVVLYDGSPLYPSPMAQLDILKSFGVTIWGTSPKFLSALKKCNIPSDLEVDCLQIVASSGAPLTPELYTWFYENFPRRIGLWSGSGGTDLVGGIVMGNPMLRIYSGEISGPALGMKVEIWDESGINIEDSGERGNLVITKPFFSMPVGFWGKDGREKYRNAYFSTFPGVWFHGDYMKKNPITGGYEILGRSDGVLNPGGVRFGTAELYGVIDKFHEIDDCIAVGQKMPKSHDENVLLFIKLRSDTALDPILQKSIRTAIQKALSPRHVPNAIHQVSDIPYTVNGKKMENLVRDIVSGSPTKASGTAANPECIQQYYEFALPREKLGKL